VRVFIVRLPNLPVNRRFFAFFLFLPLRLFGRQNGMTGIADSGHRLCLEVRYENGGSAPSLKLQSDFRARRPQTIFVCAFGIQFFSIPSLRGRREGNRAGRRRLTHIGIAGRVGICLVSNALAWMEQAPLGRRADQKT